MLTKTLIVLGLGGALGLAGCCTTPDVIDATPPEAVFTVITADGMQHRFRTDRDPPFLRGSTFEIRHGERIRVSCWAKDPSALLAVGTRGSGLVWEPFRPAPAGTDTMRDQWQWTAGDCPKDTVYFQAWVRLEDTVDRATAGMFAHNYGGVDEAASTRVTAPAVLVTFTAID